jgi:cell division protein FtsA
MASTGVVLTGGGSLLDGLDKMAAGSLGMPVRIGYPDKISGPENIMNNPMYATGAGLVLYGFETEAVRAFSPETFTGVFGKMKEWVKGIFK